MRSGPWKVHRKFKIISTSSFQGFGDRDVIVRYMSHLQACQVPSHSFKTENQFTIYLVKPMHILRAVDAPMTHTRAIILHSTYLWSMLIRLENSVAFEAAEVSGSRETLSEPD